ncbi:MAG: DUF4349 domain-containing protein [Saprospiraceae bacterium]
MKRYLWFTVLVLLFSCGNQENSMKEMAEVDYRTENTSLQEMDSKSNHKIKTQKNSPVSMQTPDFNRKMIKKADYKFEVEDVDETTLKVHELADRFSGFVANMNLSTSTTSMSNRMTVRVMNEQFEPLLNALSKEAVFVYHKRITSQDVTEQFVDLESRLNVKKEVKKRYTEMLRNNAKTLEQVLHAEEKIRVLQEEIESKEGRLKFLSDQVSLSEIQLEITQQVEYQAKLAVHNKTFTEKASDNFFNGWNSILSVALGILNYWHFGLLIGIFWLVRSFVFDLIKRY